MSRLALLAALLPVLSCAPAAAELAAYVLNERSGSVSLIETHTDQVRLTIKVGERPRGLAVSMAGERLYTSRDEGMLVERDMYARADSGGVKLGRQPSSIDLSPDGKLLAVAIPSDDEIALLDLAAMRVVKRIPVRGVKSLASAVFSPDGRWIYAAAEQSPELHVVDVKQGALASPISVGAGLRGIAFLPDGTRAYVAAAHDSEIVAIDVARKSVIARVKTAGAPGGVTPHPDGKRVFVSVAGAGKVQVLDTNANRIVGEFEACNGASSMALTPDGQKLYVTCGPANQVSVIDTATYKRLAQIPVGERPVGIVVRDANPFFDASDFPPRRGKARGS